MIMSPHTKCPECKTPLYCPCPACRKREPKDIQENQHFHWEDNGEIMICPICNFRATEDGWYFYEEMKKL